jgi:FSR family fosmidomycin resistance protein-like MFS transporter
MVGTPPSKRKVILIFALAHFSHHLCTGSLVPLLPLIRNAFGLEYFQSGLLVSAFSLAYGFGGPPAAWLADRVSRRLLIATGLIGVSVSAMAVGLSRSYAQLAVLLGLLGLLGASYHAPASSLLSSMLSRTERGRSLGLHIVGGSSAFLVTPVLAGAIATLAGWNWAFILLSLPALGVAIALAILLREPDAVAMTAGMGQTQDRVPLLGVTRALGGIVVVAVALQVVGSAFATYLPLFLADAHGVDPALAGMLGGLAIGAGVLGAPVGGALSDRVGRKPVILASLAATGPLVYLVAVVGYGPLLIGVMALYGIVMSLRMAPIESHIADVVPLNRRATVLGVYYFLGQETAGVATPLIGRVIDAVGPSQTFLLIAAVTTLLAVLTLLLRRKM